MSGKAVFLDRDGTINEEVNYLGSPEGWRLLPRAGEAIHQLNVRGWQVVLITNQSGVGRGYYTEQDVQAVHERMDADLARAGARLDGIYYCPHHPDAGCDCRKPHTLLFEQAARELNIDLTRSYAVGDKLSDLEPGRRLGCRTVLVLTGHGRDHLALARQHGAHIDYVADDLYRAVEWIKSREDTLHL